TSTSEMSHLSLHDALPSFEDEMRNTRAPCDGRNPLRAFAVRPDQEWFFDMLRDPLRHQRHRTQHLTGYRINFVEAVITMQMRIDGQQPEIGRASCRERV